MRLLKLLVAIALCLNLPLVAFAHPGRTDSAGGHYNRETGEYHYHHGNPAHQHTDKNGDGILECPYLIDGALNSSNSDVKSGKIERPKEETDSTKKSNNDWWKDSIVLIVCGIVFGFGFIVDGIKDVIDKIKQKRKK